jgi:hypothetical protein
MVTACDGAAPIASAAIVTTPASAVIEGAAVPFTVTV